MVLLITKARKRCRSRVFARAVRGGGDEEAWCSGGAALAHRYLAGESMAHPVSVLRTRAVCQAAPEADRARRRSEREREKARWHAWWRWSGRSIALGSAALACGIVSIAVGFAPTW